MNKAVILYKGVNPFPKAYGGRGGGLFGTLGDRALTVIDYWFRGPKATFIFMLHPPFAHFKRDRECIS